MTLSIAAALQAAIARIQATADTEARLETELLLCKALNKSRSHLYTWPEQNLTEVQQQQFESLLEQRIQGQPLAYILGSKAFWTFSLKVTPDTLIPRPETELLVEAALQLIPKEASANIADLGTGSGAIAIAIASERPLTNMIATDSSEQALEIARQNAINLELHNTLFCHGSWLQPLLKHPPMDLIVSNPPYIAEGDPHLERDGLPWEPDHALTSGPDGLRDIRKIIQQAPECLKPGSKLILEHGCDQGPAVRQLFQLAGYSNVVTQQDMENRDRITMGEAPVNW